MTDYGLSAAVLHERRHFLNSFDQVDWPALDADRDRLLEPGAGAQTLWRYAPTGEVTVQTDAKGHAQHFAHDRAGQLRSVGLQRFGQSRADTLVSAIQYSASGQVEHELAGNGMRTIGAYDPANEHLILLATQGPDQRFLQKLTYRYDPVGNITEIADAALPIQHFANQRIDPVRRFAYDTLYQLIRATGWESAKPSLGPALPEWQAFGPPDGSRWCNYSETYQYDEAGNLLQRIHQGAVGDTLSMRVAALSNRSVKVDPTQSGVDESFDARGNLLELQPGQALLWNGRNQLAQVTQVARVDGTDDLDRYVYDSEGTRLRKIRTSAAKSIAHTAEVRYLPGLELHGNSATGEQLQVVSVQAGRCTVRLLHWDSPPPAELENDQLRYCFDDHLGSSAFEVDAQAQVISQEVYYPFGGTAWLAGRHEVETGYKTIRYSGKERDSTGLYYYGARYYAPWLQRWLNPDPAGDVDGVNFYRFVVSNPVNFIDKHGLSPTSASKRRKRLEAGLNKHVKWRGMQEIEKHSPDLAGYLKNSMEGEKAQLSNAVAALENITFYRGEYEIVRNNFGDLSSGEFKRLVTTVKSALSRVERRLRDPGSIVVYEDKEQFKGSGALAIIGEYKNKIYVNESFHLTTTPDVAVHVVQHEEFHLNKSERVHDYWYLHTELGKDELIAVGALAQLNRFAAMEAKSKKMMAGELVGKNDFSSDGYYHLILDTNNDFNVNSKLRTEMSLTNADTLSYVVGAISRSMENSGIRPR